MKTTTHRRPTFPARAAGTIETTPLRRKRSKLWIGCLAAAALAGPGAAAGTAGAADAAKEARAAEFVRNATKGLEVVAVAQAGAPSPSPAVAEPEARLPTTARSADGKLSVSVNQSELRAGDTLEITVETEGAGFLRIFYKDASDRIAQVFPNRARSDNRLAAAGRVRVPGPEDGFVFRVKEPFGIEGLLVIFSPVQLGDAENLDFRAAELFKGFADLAELRRNLVKGLEVVEVGEVSHALLVTRTSP